MRNRLVLVSSIAVCLGLGACGTPTPPPPSEASVATATIAPTQTPVPTASPTERPTMESSAVATASGDQGRVGGQPRELIIQAADLPAGFQQAADESKAINQYSVVYIRPQAMAGPISGGFALLGVIANIGLYPNEATAQSESTSQGGLDPKSIEADIKQASPNVKEINVQHVEDMAVQGADQVLAYEVRYIVDPTPLLDERYRVRVGNVVANLIVSARADAGGQVPPEFRSAAAQLLEKQVQRLNKARQ